MPYPRALPLSDRIPRHAAKDLYYSVVDSRLGCQDLADYSRDADHSSNIGS